PPAHATYTLSLHDALPIFGETRQEISEALVDLHDAGCDLITITQYLRPSPKHHPVERWVRPEEFVELRDEAQALGFAGVMSGPLDRKSTRLNSSHVKISYA